jgi:hypothetical protein
MNKSVLIFISLLFCELVINGASSPENLVNILTPIFIEFNNPESYNQFIIESANLPGRISREHTEPTRNIFFYFYGSLSKERIDELFAEHITANCEYSIFNTE